MSADEQRAAKKRGDSINKYIFLHTTMKRVCVSYIYNTHVYLYECIYWVIFRVIVVDVLSPSPFSQKLYQSVFATVSLATGRINMLDAVQKTGGWLSKSIIYPLIQNTHTTRAYHTLGTYTKSDIRKLCECGVCERYGPPLHVARRLVPLPPSLRLPVICYFRRWFEKLVKNSRKSDYRLLNLS